MSATARQVETALQVTAIVGDCIRDLGSVPSGHLYARLMDHMDLRTYEAIVAALKQAGLVSESANLLTWTGPAKESR